MGIYLYIWTTWIILNTCYCEISEPKKKEEAKNIYQVYEYGTHRPEEKLSLKYSGIIPFFHPIYMIIVKPDVGFGSFTYLRAECLNPISPVIFNYNETRSVMTIHIKFPFINTPYGIVGYS